MAVAAALALCFTVAVAQAEPCLELKKEGPFVARPGDVITFTLTAHNCGDVYLASSVGIYDPMVWDPSIDYVGWDFVEGEGLVWARDMAPGDTYSTTVTYLVTENDCGQLVNDAWVQSPYNDSFEYLTARDDASWTVAVDCLQPGTGTPGYWKNHPEAWPVEEITIGGIVYSKTVAIGYLSSPVAKDKTVSMFKALVSAKLNVLIGNDSSCIATTIAAADAWMSMWPIGSKVRASSDAWAAGEPLFTRLDNYNNGMLCAPARD